MSVDYRLRTHKQVERNILVDILPNLASESLSSYQYIGFGAEYYKDFILFHEKLSIENMTSIERNTSMKKRYEFNLPYSFIKLKFGNAKEVLLSTSYSENSIIWLDFTDTFSDRVIEDIQLVTSKVKGRCILLFTFNVERPPSKDEYLSTFENYKPHIFETNMLSKLKYPKLVRNTMDNIVESLYSPDSKEFEWCNFFDFVYSDNAKMQTIGYVFDKNSSIQDYKVRLQNNIFSFRDESYVLNLMSLTPDEIKHLKKNIADLGGSILPWCNTVSESKQIIDSFKEIYKNYPTFAEIIG